MIPDVRSIYLIERKISNLGAKHAARASNVYRWWGIQEVKAYFEEGGATRLIWQDLRLNQGGIDGGLKADNKVGSLEAWGVTVGWHANLISKRKINLRCR